MFEKCEQATLNPDSLNNYDIKMPTNAFHSSTSSHRSRQSMASSSSTEGFRRFDDELKMFMIENQHILLNENTASSNNSEKVAKINKMLDEVVRLPTPFWTFRSNCDNLVTKYIFFCFVKLLKAIQVLRIHLLEIEKVNDLCNDFADRYIDTLRLRLNSDNIFKSDFEEEVSDERNAKQDPADGQEGDEVKSKSKFKMLMSNTDEVEADLPKDPAKKKGKISQKKLKRMRKLQRESKLKSLSKLKRVPFEINLDTTLDKIHLDMNNCPENNSNAKISESNDSNDGSVNECANQATSESNVFYHHHRGHARSSAGDNDEQNEYENDFMDDKAEDMETFMNEDEEEEEEDDDEDEEDLDYEMDDEYSTLTGKSSTSSLNNDERRFHKSDSSPGSLNSKNKRGILPKNATNVMKKWLFQHIVVSGAESY